MSKSKNSTEIDFDQMADLIFSSVEDATNDSVEAVVSSSQEIDEEDIAELVEEVEKVDRESSDEIVNQDDVEELQTNTEDTVEEDTTEEVVESDDEETNSYSILKFLLDTGELEDLEVFVDDSEEGILLSEYKDIDSDTLKTIIEEKRKKDSENLANNSVDLRGVDENQKRLINIIKNSSFEEAKQIFQNELPMREPWSDYDPLNEQHQAIAYKYYLTTALGQTEEEANDMVEIAKKNLVLDKKANAVVDKQKENYREALKQKEAELEEKAKKEKEALVQYKNSLKEYYKELPLEKAKEFIKVATTKNNDGTTVIDSKFKEVMSDPEKASELIMFLMDKDLFMKNVTAKAKTEQQIDNIKKIRIASSTKNSSRSTKNSSSSDDVDIDDTLKTIFNLK